jgi:hypothetical protein
MQYLVGNLPHRGAYTENERLAAEYIRERLQEYTPDTEIDAFTSIESHYYLFASYYAEFLFVAVAAIWFPHLAFVYGLLVFLAYLAEFTTYRVTARFLGPNPRSLFIVTANYDSPREGPLSTPALRDRLRWVHFVVVISMVIVLITCAVQAFGLFPEEFRPELVVRWSAVAFLLSAAALLFFHEVGGEFSSGAIDNASGVAALLALAERLNAKPLLDQVEVWLVATGAKDAWMSGMHHFIRTHNLDRTSTYFLHIDNVGNPELRYTTGEGLLQTFHSDPGMLEAARRVAGEYDATPFCDRSRPSDALVTLVRGFKTLRVTGVARKRDEGEERLPNPPDGLARVDYRAILGAATFAEATLRELAAALVRVQQPAPSRSVN